MIFANPPMTAGRAANYYRTEYTRGDFHAADRSVMPGTWQGRGAERLGLTGGGAIVKHQDFAALLQGRSPADGSQLVAAQHGTGKHTAVWDFVAAPGKSVSLVGLLGPDPRVVAAHLAAAARAFEILEQQALANCQRRLVPTGNLVIARFDHETSRALDPHLHSHHLIFNLTDRASFRRRSVDPRPPSGHGHPRRATPAAGGRSEWRALATQGIFAAIALATAVYQAELARGIQTLGYDVSVDGSGNVHILGIPEAAVDAFSKRKHQILAYIARQSAFSIAPDNRRAALNTRGAKLRNVDPAALHATWRTTAKRLGIDFAALRRAADERLDNRQAGNRPASESFEQARDAVAWAVERLAARQAPCRAINLETLAIRRATACATARCPGRGPDLGQIRAAIASQAGVIPLRAPAQAWAGLPAAALVTTEAAIRLERHNLALIRAGRLSHGRPVLATHHPYFGGATLVPDQLRDVCPILAPDQLRVVRHILESRAPIVAVESEPGAGRALALAASRQVAEAAGWSVHAFVVTAAARSWLREAGYEAGQDAATPRSLAAPTSAWDAEIAAPAGSTAPAEPDSGAGTGGAPSRQLWFVYGAERMNHRDAATALDSARRAGARLVLIGDRFQRRVAEERRPWVAFQDAGLRPARLDPVRPPRDRELPRAVELAAEGRAGDAVRHLERRCQVVEIAGAGERHVAMVQELASSWFRPGGPPDPQALRDTLMVAPSPAERRELNALARRELVARGAVESAGVSFEIAVGKGLTLAQRGDLRHYAVGDVVTYAKAAPGSGFRAGDSARVVAVGGVTAAGGEPRTRTVTVQHYGDGTVVEVDPRRLRGELARAESLELAAGDRVRFQRPDRSRSIPGDAIATVRGASPGRLVLELDPRPGKAATRIVTLDIGRAPLPLDHAYAVAPHAAKGATVRRVLATFDTRHGAELVNRRQAKLTLSRASHQLIVYTDDRAALPGAVDRPPATARAIDVRQPPRRDRHAPAPLARDTAPSSHRYAARRRPEQPGRTEQVRVQSAERPGRAAGITPDHARRSADSAAAPGHRPRARAGRGADRAPRPRGPLPRHGAERSAREESRPSRAAYPGRRPGDAAERDSPLRRLGGALDPGDASRGPSPGQPGRSAEDALAQWLIAAAERWHAAAAGRGDADGRSAAAGSGAAAREQRPAAPAVRPFAAAPHQPRVRRGPLHDLQYPRTASSALSALHFIEDPEHQLVRLIKQIGPARALAILPPVLARAVRGLRAVERLLEGPSLDR